MSFIKGMDISIQRDIEQLGAVYFDKGKQEDAFQILGNYGTNMIRLRIWNDPYDADGKTYGGGTNDLATTIALARRAKQQGMGILLDFHYSDFWADPSTQVMPKAWEGLTGKALEEAVYQFTFDTLKELEQEQLLPQMVQIGNEITNGLLWPDGKLENVEAMCGLLEAGLRATRDVSVDIRTMIHLDWGGDNALYRKWFDAIASFNLQYDIIGLSYYSFWHGTLDQLVHNMNDISARYSKDVIVAETAFPFTTEQIESEEMIFTEEHAKDAAYSIDPQGQSQFMLDLMQAIKSVNNGRGLGFFYWEPTWLNIGKATWTTEEGIIYLNKQDRACNVWANLALFDFKGNALPALETINKF